MQRNNRGPIPLWQLALYVAVLGVISMLLAPVTSVWWIVPLLGAAIPVAMAVIQGRAHTDEGAGAPQVTSTNLDTRVTDRAALAAPDEPPPLAASLVPATEPLSSVPERAEPESGLSERELEVLALLASGKTNAEVAAALFISVGTVKSHSANIYRKLEAKNRTEAVARARELGLLP